MRDDYLTSDDHTGDITSDACQHVADIIDADACFAASRCFTRCYGMPRVIVRYTQRAQFTRQPVLRSNRRRVLPRLRLRRYYALPSPYERQRVPLSELQRCYARVRERGRRMQRTAIDAYVRVRVRSI